MSRLLLIMDISHDKVTVSDFDILRFRPVSVAHYSLMDFCDIRTVLQHHLRQGSSSEYETCCIICDAIYSDEWIIPAHNPRMQLSVSELKIQTGIYKICCLSPSEALAFSSKVKGDGVLQHLTGPDNRDDTPIIFTAEIRERFSCSLFTGEETGGTGYTDRIILDDPLFTTDDIALNDFMRRYGNGALLNERGLVLLYGYFCAGKNMQAGYPTYRDVLSGSPDNDEPVRKAALSTYFTLLNDYFLQVRQRVCANEQNTTFVIHTTQPDLFAVNFRRYTAAISDSNQSYSIYVNQSETLRLYGAARLATN